MDRHSRPRIVFLRTWLLLGVIAIPPIMALAWHGASGEQDIRAVLEAQAAAWNKGDIDGFMRGYWESDELTFSSGGTVTRGWNATLRRYRTRYATRDKMGQLTFSDLEVRMLGDDAALVLGRWQLRRKEDAPGGIFTLVFRRMAGRWLIIHDHTSSDEPSSQPATRGTGG